MEARDLPRLKEIHAEMGSTYPLPDLESAQFQVVEVIADEDDIPVMAIACRKTVEAYLLLDHRWRSPKWRWSGFARLHSGVCGQLKAAGYTDAQCWIAPELVERFGMKRLVRQFGWVKSAWQSFFKEF